MTLPKEARFKRIVSAEHLPDGLPQNDRCLRFAQLLVLLPILAKHFYDFIVTLLRNPNQCCLRCIA